MGDKPFIISVTGPRPGKLTVLEVARAIEAIGNYLEKAKAEHPNLRVLLGGARGIDDIARCECVRLGINYTLVIPHKDYGLHYWEDDLGYYEYCLRTAPKVVYVVEGKDWDASFNNRRNEYLVKWADAVLGIFAGDIPADLEGPGGTKHCLRTALAAGKPVVHIDPRKTPC